MSVSSLLSSYKFSAVCRLPFKGFSCNSMFWHYRQYIWTVSLVWTVAVWPAVAGSTNCILMFLCVTWHRHWYIWLLYIADSCIEYCSVAVWPAVAGSTKCILMFLYVTWHWYIWLLYVADSYVVYCSVVVWPAVADSTKGVLMFLCVTWHWHWYIWLLCVFLSWCNWYVAVTTWQQTTRNTNTKYSTQQFKIKWILCDKFQNSSLLEVRLR